MDSDIFECLSTNQDMAIKFSAVLLLIALQSTSTAQPSHTPNNLKITVHIPAIVKDSSDLKARIVVKNLSDTAITLYTELLEGVFDGTFDNDPIDFRLVVQRKFPNGFREHRGRAFIDPAPDDGPARDIKCFYYKDVRKNSSTVSNWCYFRVIKPINIRHYFEEEFGLIPNDKRQ